MTLSYVNWYLVELRRRIHESIPLEQENSFIFETKNHLESLIEEFEEQGMERRQAEIAAIERFGTPDSIASECLLGHRRLKEKRLVQVAGVLFCALMVYVTFASIANVRGYPYGYSYSAFLAPLVAAFGLYALLIGKIPSWKWFALPLALSTVFGAYHGLTSTYYTIPGTFGLTTSYNGLHERYITLKAQHEQASKVEHEAADSWRATIANAKDLGKGATLEVSRIEYHEQPIRGSRFDGDFNPPTIFAQSGVYDDHNRFASFQFLPEGKKLVLAGPLSAHDVRNVASGRLREAQMKHKQREIALTAIQAGLNVPVKERMWGFIYAQDLMYLVVVLPLSFCVSFVTSKVRNRIRFKANKLRLA